MEYIYIIQVEKDFGKNIYKIGKTTQIPFKRFISYCEEVQIIQFNSVANCHTAEKELIHEFTKTFGKPVRGFEYFEGDLNLMLEIFNIVIMIDIPQIKKIHRLERKYNRQNKKKKIKKDSKKAELPKGTDKYGNPLFFGPTKLVNRIWVDP
jgi:hypothetical protein